MIGISVERVGICGKKKECNDECTKRIIAFYNYFHKEIEACFIDVNHCHLPLKALLPIPIIIHGDCLIKKKTICRLDFRNRKTWEPYKKFITKNNVLALVVNPPRQIDYTLEELNSYIEVLSTYLGVHVYLKTSQLKGHWCSSLSTTTNNIAIDTDDVLAWNNGDSSNTAKDFHRLLGKASLIYLTYPVDFSDSATENIQTSSSPFSRYVEAWAGEKFVVHKPYIN
jgi:hypothetical protein